MNSAVLDSGPLIHLSELGVLDVLSDFEVLHVPPVVWEEVNEYQPQALANINIKLTRTENPMIDTGLTMLTQALSLDQGEIQALAIMANYPNAIFLTDDSAARLAAEEIGYKVHGTIGLLIRSVRKGFRSPQDVLKILRSLELNSSLHIRKSFLLNVIKRLEEDWISR